MHDVLRDRLGELEDRFFGTVFLGSGLLFLAMLFASAALGRGIIIAYDVSTLMLNHLFRVDDRLIIKKMRVTFV
jgi:hypothetical protein